MVLISKKFSLEGLSRFPELPENPQTISLPKGGNLTSLKAMKVTHLFRGDSPRDSHVSTPDSGKVTISNESKLSYPLLKGSCCQ